MWLGWASVSTEEADVHHLTLSPPESSSRNNWSPAASTQQGWVSSVTQMCAQALGTFTLVSASISSLVLVIHPAFPVVQLDPCIAPSLKEIVLKTSQLNGVMNRLLTPQQAAAHSTGTLSQCLQDGVDLLGLSRVWWSPQQPGEEHLPRCPRDWWKAQDSCAP